MTQLIDDIWPAFKHSPEYAELITTENPSYLRATANLAVTLLDDREPADWDVQVLNEMLREYLAMATEDDEEDGAAAFWTGYRVMKALLTWLARHQRIAADSAALAQLFADYERDIPFAPTIGGLIDFEDDAAVSGLPLWQPAVASRLAQETTDWFAGFAQLKSSAKYRQHLGVAGLLRAIHNFVERAYDVWRKTPRSWSKHAIVQTFLSPVYRRSLGVDEAALPWVGKALLAFIDYGAKHGFVTPRHATQIRPWLQAGADELVAAGLPADDGEDAAVAERVQAALDSGDLDPANPDSIAAFTDQLMAEFGPQPADPFADLPTDSAALAAMAADAQQVEQLVAAADEGIDVGLEPNDRHAGRQHNQGVAELMHHQGLVWGVRLWLRRNEFALAPEFDAQLVVSGVSQFVDGLYAELVADLNDWTPAVFREYRLWLLGQGDRHALAALLSVVQALLQLLERDRTLTAATSVGLQLALGLTPKVRR